MLWRERHHLELGGGAVRETGNGTAPLPAAVVGLYLEQCSLSVASSQLGPGRPLPTFPTSECASDVEPDTRELVRAQNKKKKKSGGFQSMGG